MVVEHEGRALQRVPKYMVDRVLALGAVGLTTPFLNFALGERIAVTFLTQHGHWRGRLDPGARRDVALRLAQFRRLEDLDWRLAIGRRIVHAKVAAQRALLMRAHRNCRQEGLAAGARDMEGARKRIDAATGLPQLMGAEGHAARIYFRALPGALHCDFEMRGRSRRPPRDPVNALLSLGYGLLTAEIIGALGAVGLDPQIGVFHSPRGRVPALAEDLLETFRAPVADSLALSLLNLRVLAADSFSTGDDGGVTLTRAALQVYFRYFRRRMTEGFHDRTGRPTSFRRELQAQAARMRRAILDEAEFEPFVAPAGGPDRKRGAAGGVPR